MFEWLDNAEAYLPDITPEIKQELLKLRTEMAKNPTTHGFKTAKVVVDSSGLSAKPSADSKPAKPSKKKQARLLKSANDNLQSEGRRIVHQYGLSSSNALELPAVKMILNIEKAGKECEGCGGDCHKCSFRYAKAGVAVYHGQWYEAFESCPYGRQRALEREFRAAAIPARYIGKTFADYTVDADNEIAVKAAQYVLHERGGVYYYGECGVGKTFLAALIAQEFLKAGKTVLFAKVPDLLSEIRSTFDGSGSEADKLNALRGVDVLILDDFGMEKPTQWAGSTLCKVLDMRYDRRDGVTIITSNLSPAELAQHLDYATDGDSLNGSRIFDRCREICKPVLLKGNSRRT